MVSSNAAAAKRVRDDLAYARFSMFHVKVREERSIFAEEQEKGRGKRDSDGREQNHIAPEVSSAAYPIWKLPSPGLQRISKITIEDYQHLEVLRWLQKEGSATAFLKMKRAFFFCNETSSTGTFDLKPAALEKNKTKRQAILVAGAGFFSDAYDLFIIGLAKPAIGVVYFPENGGKLPTNVDLAITGVSLIGALTGQVVFGCVRERRESFFFLCLYFLFISCWFSSSCLLRGRRARKGGDARQRKRAAQ